MAQLQLIKQSNNTLISTKPETSESWHFRYKLGVVLEADLKLYLNLNTAFYRRFFALLNLGFEYWILSCRVIIPIEKKLNTEYARYLAPVGGVMFCRWPLKIFIKCRYSALRSNEVQIIKQKTYHNKKWLTTVAQREQCVLCGE